MADDTKIKPPTDYEIRCAALEFATVAYVDHPIDALMDAVERIETFLRGKGTRKAPVKKTAKLAIVKKPLSDAPVTTQ